MSCFVGVFGNNAGNYNLAPAIDVIHSGDYNKSPLLIKGTYFQISGASKSVFNDLATTHIDNNHYLLIDGRIYNQTPNNTTILDLLTNRDKLLSSLKNLNGQFSFACIDNQRMILCRDHLGIKSLYYSHRPDGSILFSSDIKVLKILLGASISLNRHVIECYRGIGYNLFPGETVYQDIHSLKPGEYMEFQIDGSYHLQTYYELPNKMVEDDKTIDISQIQTILNNGFKQCVDCDIQIPKAMFFSGGLDSSYLLAYLTKSAKSRIVPFTLWDSSNDSDIVDARVLASELDIDLLEHEVDWKEIDRMIIHYAWHFAMPLGGNGFDLLGGVAFHALAGIIAHKGFKVALCGEGADELFIGYHQYHMDPSMLVSRLENAINTHGLYNFKDRLMELGVFSHTDESLRRIAFDYGLSEYHLHSVDCSGSAFGLEIRPPYLNYKLADKLLKYPLCQFIDKKDYWTKIPLRKMFMETMPQTSARTAIRRKRAMSYALHCFNDRLNEEIEKIGVKISPAEAFWRLFFYLHIDNCFSSVPSFSFTDILPELDSMGER